MTDQQPNLFNPATIPHDTLGLKAITLGRWHYAILRALHKHSALTDEGLFLQIGHRANTLRPRRLELSQRHYIEKADRAHVPSGRTAQRWRLTDRGREALAAEEARNG